ncbi:MAG: glucokinase [Terriglobales bacterium]|jgi:glucokinase
MILAGDIGGTSARLAYFEEKDSRLVPVVEEVKHGRDYPSLQAAVLEFKRKYNYAADCACFGVAGPVNNGRVDAPNLPWVIEAATLEREAGIRQVHLINDLEANAYGLSELDEQDFEVLTPGVAGARGNAAVISAGTGLGEAGLFWDGARHHPFAAEGGHTDFAPANEVQIELWRCLRTKFGGHVSWERVLSGPGQHNIYEFLRDSGRGKEESWLAEEMKIGDPSAVITRHGLSGKSPLCEQAVDVFVEIYGAAAGNLGLKFLAVSGVFVGGGIAPKILAKLKEPRFIDAFRDKGRLRPLMETIPVRVVLNDKTALLGAGHVAMLHCGR